MTKYGMCVASMNKVSEHVRACSEFGAERENSKDKTAQATKDKFTCHKFSVHSFLDFHGKFFLFAISRTRQTVSGTMRCFRKKSKSFIEQCVFCFLLGKLYTPSLMRILWVFSVLRK